jgi:hypothetical protein
MSFGLKEMTSVYGQGAWLRALVLFGGLLVGAGSVAAQEFSAEIITRNSAGEIVGAPAVLYAAGTKVRIETPELQGRHLIVDSSVPSSYLVHPKSHIYLDAKQSSRLTRLFIRLDPHDPCPQLHAMAKVAGLADGDGQWRCEKMDHENVAGRATVKFVIESPGGPDMLWIDTEFGIPIRVEVEGGATLELQNIEVGPQSADKFIIPANYKKFDLRTLFERLKHSDVWVEPPK